MKRILSMLMAAVIIFGMIPANVFAENTMQPTSLPNEQGNATVNNENITVTGTNDFGDLISKDIQKEQDAQAEALQTGYDVISLTVNDNTATVEYFAKGEASIVVAIYSEDRTQLLTSGKVDVTADETTTTISLPDTLPEYFHASAYMVSKKDQKPLCSALHTTMYTKDMQELLESTIYDYDPDLVVNLDDRTDTNFAVYSEDTVVVEEQTGINIVVSVDDENLTYVIDNPSMEIRSLMYGDVISIPYGEDDILFIKVDRVAVSGTRATITGLPIEMQDVFSYVKIDGEAGAENAEVDTETADEGVTFEGITEDRPTRAIEGGSSFTHTLSYKFFKDVKGGPEGKLGELTCQLNGAFNLKISLDVKYYITLFNQEFKFSINAIGEFQIGVEGTAKLNIPLGRVAIPVFAGINVGLEPALVFEVNGKAELTISVTSKSGFAFVSGEGIKNISEPLKANASVEAEITIFAGFDLAPQVSVISPSVAKVTVSVPIGVEVTAKMTGSAVEGPEALTENNHTCTYCIEIALDVKFGISIKMTLLDRSWLTWGFKIIELKWRILDGYYSIDHNEFGWTQCPYRAYPLTITVLDSDSKPVEGVTIQCTPVDCTLKTGTDGKTTVYLPNGDYILNASKGDYAGSVTANVNGASSATLKVILNGNVTENVKWSLTESGALTISGNGAIPSYGDSSQLPWSKYISQVKSVSISDGITAIGANVFQNHSNLIYVYIGSSVSSIDFSAFAGLNLPMFSVSSANKYYTLDQKGVLFNKNKTILYKALIPLSGTYDIPDTVTNVASKAFAGQTGISLIHFTGNAPIIASDAFGGVSTEMLYCTRTTGWTQDKLQQYGGTITWSSYDGMLGSGTFGNQLTWQFYNDGVLRITGAGDMPNYTSSSRAPWYKYRSSIKEVVIFNGITGIGDYAFNECAVLETITIPSGVNRIGKYAFYNCSALTDITIPKSISTISTYTFYNCSSLTDIHIPEGVSTVESYAFYGCSSLQSINIPEKVTIINEYTFYNCSSLKNIQLYDDITAIGKYAFYNCSSLKSIHLQDGITTIGEYAFYNCSSFQEIIIPISVTDIGQYAFSNCSSVLILRIHNNWNPDFSGLTIGANAFANCTSLRSAKIPDSTIKIGEKIFSGCGNLTSISIPFVGDQRRANTETTKHPLGYIFGTSNYTGAAKVSQKYNSGTSRTYYIPSSLKTVIVTGGEITNYAFLNCTGLQNVVIPESATVIGDYAFSGCTGLQSIHIPKSVITIGQYAFQKCSGLMDVVIPNSVTSLGYAAFDSCTNLTQITLSANLTVFGSSAFQKCTSLTEIIIPEGLTRIGGSAFSGCTALTSVSIPDCVTEIGASAFSGCTKLASVTLGTGIRTIGSNAFYNCSKLTEVHITDAGAWCYIQFDSTQANPLYYGKNLYVNGTLVSEVNVPADATNISAYAFYNCSSLSRVTIPEGLTEIGTSAFYNCGALSNVTIGEGITTIGTSAFTLCKKLTEITIPNSVTTVGKSAFSSCSSLTSVTIPFVGENASGSGDNTQFSFAFPSSVQTVTVTGGSLRSNAFNSCTSLRTVNLQEGVKYVAVGAFSGCSNLQSISIPARLMKFNKYGFDYYHLGFLFGSTSYTGGVATTHSSSSSTFYVPSSLTSVTIISGVIPTNSFYGCTMIRNVVIGNGVTDIPSGVFSSCTNLSYNTYDNAKYLGNAENPYYALISATSTSITSCNIHPDTKLIADRAFYSCSGLTSVALPGSLQRIGCSAFSYCSKLTSVTIPEGVTDIGDDAFRGCTGLSNISIPDSVTYMGTDVFYSCSNLQYSLYEGGKYLGNSKNPYVVLVDTESTTMSSCEIHPDTKIIYYEAFRDCKQLTEITIPDGVTCIGEYAFYNCSSLTGMIFPDSVKHIGYGALVGCSGLESISVPFAGTSTDATGTDAYLGNLFGKITSTNASTGVSNQYYNVPKSLKSITIMGGRITYDTFTDFERADSIIDSFATTIQNIYISEGVESIGAGALSRFSKLKSLTVPAELLLCSQSDAQYYHLGYLFGTTSYDNGVASNATYYDNSGKYCTTTYYIPATLNQLTLLGESVPERALSQCKMLTEVVIDRGITSIGNNAFYYCTGLTSVTIPDSVQSIGNYAFTNCSSLTGVKIPEGVASIGTSAFASCSSLTNVTIPNGVSSIGESAFSNCKGLTSFVIPNSVQSIGNNAFMYCSGLTGVFIPDSVQSIGNSAFADCTGVKEITFRGNAPTLGTNVFRNISATAYYPAGNATWTSDVMKNYNGTIKWVSYTPTKGISYSITAEPEVEVSVAASSSMSDQRSVTLSDSAKMRTVTFEGLDPGEEYIFLSLVSENEENPLIYENLLYIDQLCADENGVITISYIPRFESDTVFELVSGGALKNLAEATITWPEYAENGSQQFFVPTVSYNGETLTENVDYVLEGEISFSVPGIYHCYVVGIGDYIGSYACTYTVAKKICTHSDFTILNAVSPTCTEPGKTQGKQCNQCGEILEAQSEIPATGHTIIELPAVAATCTKPGKTAGSCCGKCNTTIVDQTAVLPLGHSYVNGVCVTCGGGNFDYIQVSWNEQEANGELQYFSPTVFIGEVQLREGIDYTLEGDTSFVDSGSYTCSVVGIGNYTGRFTFTYTVKECTFSQGLAYTRSGDDTYYSVSGIGTCTDTDIVIPAEYNGLPIKQIASYAFENCSNLTSVTIPDSVTSIGSYALRGCRSLTSITIPDSVTSIGSYAFYYCSSLTGVTIPDGVTRIEFGVFRECGSLASITIPEGVVYIGSDAFTNCVSLTGIWVDVKNQRYYSDDFGVLFNKQQTQLIQAPGKITGNYVIPDGVTSVGSYAFYNCEGLTGIRIPADISKIETSTFFGCCSLTSVTIPDGVTSIGSYAFRGCSSLTSVTIPDGVISIGSNAFSECSSLTSITIPDGVTSVESWVFAHCSSLTSVTIPDGVTSIGSYAFYCCNSLTNVTIPGGVNSIGTEAFSYCKGLTSITIPNGVTSIEFGVFKECRSLTSITIPYGVTSIASEAFFNCNRLESITIPYGVTNIGSKAFYFCSKLTSITIPDGVTSIGSRAFWNCFSLTSITIPNGVTSLGDSLFLGCSKLTEITIQGDAPAFGLDIFKNVTATAYYPAGNTTWTADVMQNYGGTITWVAYEPVVDRWNLVLEDDLKVNFSLNLDADDSLHITIGGISQTYDASVLEKTNDGKYMVSVNVAAAQMTDEIKLQVADSDEILTYTIRQYCDTILADEQYSQYHALVKEMLNYGAMAQVYFDYDAENLANEGITGTVVTDIPEIAEDLTVTDKVSDLSFYGASLVYRDRIAVRYYFTGDFTGCTFTANGNTYTPVAKDGMYYIEIADILPQDLDQQITLTVTDASSNTLSVTYGPMNYIVRMNQKGTETLQDLLKALYNYHLAAKALTA